MRRHILGDVQRRRMPNKIPPEILEFVRALARANARRDIAKEMEALRARDVAEGDLAQSSKNVS